MTTNAINNDLSYMRVCPHPECDEGIILRSGIEGPNKRVNCHICQGQGHVFSRVGENIDDWDSWSRERLIEEIEASRESLNEMGTTISNLKDIILKTKVTPVPGSVLHEIECNLREKGLIDKIEAQRETINEMETRISNLTPPSVLDAIEYVLLRSEGPIECNEKDKTLTTEVTPIPATVQTDIERILKEKGLIK